MDPARAVIYTFAIVFVIRIAGWASRSAKRRFDEMVEHVEHDSEWR